MERLWLQVKKRKDRRRLEDWLGKLYQLLLPDAEHPLEGECDLVMIDGPSLKQFRTKVWTRRKAEEPALLPFLLLTVRRRGSMPSVKSPRPSRVCWTRTTGWCGMGAMSSSSSC